MSIETAEIYSYSYHVIPLNKTISYKCQLPSSNFIPWRKCFLFKAWFPYYRYDRCDRCYRWDKKKSAIAAIIVIIWKPLSSDRWDSKKSFSAIVVAAIARKWFPYDCYDRCDRWTFFLLAITAIVATDLMETRLKIRIFTE